MGKIYYGSSGREVDIDDRTLTHLRILIHSKLRRQECFAFTWTVEAEQGSGRGTIWLSPGVKLEFAFHGNRTPTLNPAWIHALSTTAEHGELVIVPEPPGPVGRTGNRARF